MNKRIKELAEQAMATRKHVPPVWQMYDIEMEKFAELIIKECLDQIDKATPCTNCSSSEDYKTAKIAATARIQQHFEVKD